MGFEEEADSRNDYTFKLCGILVVIARDQLHLFQDAVIDFSEDSVQGRGFVFENPNNFRETVENPARLELSLRKLRQFHRDLFQADSLHYFDDEAKRRVDNIRELMWYGDARAAVVVSTEPLLVAAFSAEIDCIALLRFPDKVGAAYRLQRHSKLLSVNGYSRGVAGSDLTPGPYAGDRFHNFASLIADFLSDDRDQIRELKSSIEPSEWQRTIQLARLYLQDNGPMARNGLPLNSYRAAF